MRRVYLDNNATTRVAPEVIEAMAPFFKDLWGNPSSMHAFGGQVRKHVDQAREQVAALLQADPAEIVFTGCGRPCIGPAAGTGVGKFTTQHRIAIRHAATMARIVVPAPRREIRARWRSTVRSCTSCRWMPPASSTWRTWAGP